MSINIIMKFEANRKCNTCSKFKDLKKHFIRIIDNKYEITNICNKCFDKSQLPKINEITEIKCTSCNEIKLKDEYYFNSKNNRYYTKCRNCCKMAHDKWVDDNRDKINKYNTDYQRNHEGISEKKRIRARQYIITHKNNS